MSTGNGVRDALEAAFEEEIAKVGTLEFNANDIAREFYKRLFANLEGRINLKPDASAICLLKTERHPDRCIEEIIGPFWDYAEAEKESKRLYNREDNLNAPYNHRLFDFDVRTMEKPE